MKKPLPDYRKYCIWRILAPYLINVKCLPFDESFNIIDEWLCKCNDLEPLDFDTETKVKVRGIDNFKQWVTEDLSAFPDMKITVLDDFGEENKIAIRWNLKATHEKDFADFPATHKKFETQGVDIFHFEGDKIKEAWTLRTHPKNR